MTKEEKQNILKGEDFLDIGKVMNFEYEDKFNIEDLLCRRLYLIAPVDEAAIETIVYHIFRYNYLDRDIEVSQRKPIHIYISTYGGDEISAFSIIDACLNSETPVYMINIGACMSAGLLIYLAGHKRFSMPHSQFLLHDGQTGGMVQESVAKARDRMEFETIQLEEVVKDYVISRTNISEDLYDEKYLREWYFLPTEGKQLGVVDYIIGEDCKMRDVL